MLELESLYSVPGRSKGPADGVDSGGDGGAGGVVVVAAAAALLLAGLGCRS